MTDTIVRYVVKGSDNKSSVCHVLYEHAANAAKRRDMQFPEDAPHRVYALTLVEPPKPPRPSVQCGDSEGATVYWCKRDYYHLFADANGRRTTRGTVGDLVRDSGWRFTDEQIAELLTLSERTAAWEAEHGGNA